MALLDVGILVPWLWSGVNFWIVVDLSNVENSPDKRGNKSDEGKDASEDESASSLLLLLVSLEVHESPEEVHRHEQGSVKGDQNGCVPPSEINVKVLGHCAQQKVQSDTNSDGADSVKSTLNWGADAARLILGGFITALAIATAALHLNWFWVI